MQAEQELGRSRVDAAREKERERVEVAGTDALINSAEGWRGNKHLSFQGLV